jgi:MerR family transcriptional regulator, copper efflux regulator
MHGGKTIGQAAGAAGLTPKAIRLYETKGLLPPLGRSHAGYRLYSENDIDRLRFIRQARALGLRLHDIAQVIHIAASGSAPCPTVRELLDQHVADIDRTIADLTALRRTLTTARTRDTTQPAQLCPIIETA